MTEQPKSRSPRSRYVVFDSDDNEHQMLSICDDHVDAVEAKLPEGFMLVKQDLPPHNCYLCNSSEVLPQPTEVAKSDQ